MNYRLSFIALVLTAVFAWSCSSNSEESADGEKKEGFEKKYTKSERLQIIDELQEKAFSNDSVMPKRALANDLMRNYFEYKNLYPKDSVSPEFLFKGGQVAMSIGKYHKAIEVFNVIYEGYPDYNKRVEALNLVAFNYDYNLKDRNQARKVYEFIVQNFPEHHLAEDAAARLTTLEMSDQELIEYFEKQNQEE